MGVKPEDRVVVVVDKGSRRIGEALKDILLEITPHVRFFNLDIYGKRPLTYFPETMKNAAMDATVTFWTAKAVEGELETVRGPFIKAALYDGRHAHMVNITEDIVKTGLVADYNKVEEFTKSLHSILKGVKEIRVETDLGTKLTAEVGKYKWIATTGVVRDVGLWNNLPDGMVYTVPQNMKGKAVVDGTLGDYFDEVYSLSQLESTPLKVEIEDGSPPRMADLKCDNKDIERDIKEYLNRHECSSYVGELGFGTNPYITKMIGSMLVDEKAPGFHIAFGDPNQDMTFASWSCPEHIDMVIQKCDVWLDDEKFMENGRYLKDLV